MMTWQEQNEDYDYNEFLNSLMAFNDLKNKNIKNFKYSIDFKLKKDILEKNINDEWIRCKFITNGEIAV